ncbi:MAG: host-nuclease inhibitor Gam family protein [Afipia sp.]
MVKAKAMAAAATYRIPQSRDEAQTMLAEYGTTARQIEIIETECNQALADIKEKFVQQAKPLNAQADALFKGLQTYCDANRATLTGNDRNKTVDLGTGKVSWRHNPAKVNIRGKVEDVIARIKEGGDRYFGFLRATVEIDKVALLRNPNLAATIEGVKIASAGETFTVEPFSDEQLAETA